MNSEQISAQKNLLRAAKGFSETPTGWWKEELTRAILAVEEAAESAYQVREAAYLKQEQEPLWWDDASYADYQARD